MSEKELTPEEIVKRIEQTLEEVKKLPGGTVPICLWQWQKNRKRE